MDKKRFPEDFFRIEKVHGNDKLLIHDEHKGVNSYVLVSQINGFLEAMVRGLMSDNKTLQETHNALLVDHKELLKHYENYNLQGAHLLTDENTVECAEVEIDDIINSLK